MDGPTRIDSNAVMHDRRSTSHYAETSVRVRYAETDQMGVVYYGNYFTWFEIGRVELCRQLGFEYKKMENEDDSFIVVAEANCRYKRPGAIRRRAAIRTRVIAVPAPHDRVRLRNSQSCLRRVIATGETVHVICDRTGRPKSLPEKYRKYFPASRMQRNPACCRVGNAHPDERSRMKIQIDGEHLTFDQLYSVVFERAEVEISARARERMNASRAVIERVIDSDAPSTA